MGKKFLYLFVIAFGWLVLVDVGCSRQGREKPRTPPSVPVTVSTAVRQTVPLQIRAVGTAEAFATVTVRSNVTGEVTRVGFREGQDVKEGQFLFGIDCRDLEAALRQAEANLARDEALSRNAEEDATRFRYLAEKGYVAQQQYDQVRTNAESARAVAAASRAVVDNTKVRLGYCTIRSPLSGRAGDLKVDRGNLVKENDSVLVTINRITPIYVAFAVPEKYLPEIKRYWAGGKLRVEAYIPNDPFPEVGFLTFIDNRVDNATGTIGLKATLQNQKKRLWPGQFLNVVVTLTEKPGILVPTRSVLTGQKGTYVFVVKPGDTVEIRPVETTRTYQDKSVIDKGLEPGERVVLDGQLRLVDGARVSIKGTQ